jgi:hypothetical protein
MPLLPFAAAAAFSSAMTRAYARVAATSSSSVHSISSPCCAGFVVAAAPDEQAMLAGLVNIAGAGNVRSETLRAFTGDEMASVLQRTGQKAPRFEPGDE